MTRECELALIVKDTGENISISGSFEEEKWELLESFVQYADDLLNTNLIQTGRTFRTSRTRYRATPSVRASEEPRVSPHQPENLPVEVVEFGLEDLDESPGLA